MWKLNVNFLTQGALDKPDSEDGIEIDNVQWKQVNITGKFPDKISHHQGVVQDISKELIIYGGIVGIEGSDTLYVVDLNKYNFTAIPAA